MTKNGETLETSTGWHRRALLALSLAVLAPWGLGFWFPDRWWGSHFLAFLPGPWVVGMVGAALAILVFYPRLPTRSPSATGERDAWHRRRLVRAFAVGIGYAVACYLLTTATDAYGDARRNIAYVDRAILHGNPGWVTGIFSVNLLFRETGEHFVMNIVGLIGSGLGVSGRSAFEIFNAAMGLAFAVIWTSFVQRALRGPVSRVLLIVAGLVAGFAPMFTDHAEIYAPAVVCLTGFLVVAIGTVETRDRKRLGVLVILFLLAAKCHFANLLLGLPLVIVALDTLAGGSNSRISRKNLMLGAAVPLIVAFCGIYFFVMHNQAISRFVDAAGRAKTFFLPLVNVESNGAPPYTIFSLSHAFDYLNVVMLWSLPAVLVILFGWVFRRRTLIPAPPAMALSELVLLVYAGVFFLTNPVLGMPRDWDLFTIPAVALLVYAVLVAARIEEESPLPNRVVGAGFAAAALSLSIFAVHNNATLLSARIESLGVCSYRSYWKGASYLLNVSATLGDPDEATVLKRRVRAYRKIRQYALPVDGELADLALRLSALYRKREEYEKAEPYARDALDMSRGNRLCVYELALVQFGLGEYAGVYRVATALCEAEPVNASFLELAFLSGLRVRDLPRALSYGERYLKQRPDDLRAVRLLRNAKTTIGDSSQ